jgi:hypothetical protein
MKQGVDYGVVDKRKEAAMRDIQRQVGVLLLVLSALLLATSGTASAAETTWVDEIWGMVNFEKATYPSSNFDPYFEKLTVIREGVARHDRQAVKKETDRFLKMLADRAHGINDVAADEIYNFALGVRPTEEITSAAIPELGIGTERPMSVPDHSMDRSYESTECDASCDFWAEDALIPGG